MPTQADWQNGIVAEDGVSLNLRSACSLDVTDLELVLRLSDESSYAHEP